MAWCLDKYRDDFNFTTSAEVKRMRGAIPSPPHTSSWRDVQLSTGYNCMAWYLDQRPTQQPPIQEVLGALSFGVKRPWREADHLPSSSAVVKNAWNYTSICSYVFIAWCLVKPRDNSNFTFPYQTVSVFAIQLSDMFKWLNQVEVF